MGGWEKGEASRSVCIFSREFGVIYATVQNARSINSKLRYSVQDYSLGNFTLVKGKNSWKLVGAETEKNLNQSLKQNLKVFASILSLIKRLTAEEKNEELYNIIFKSIGLFERTNEKDLKEIEILTVLKILKNLGYVEETLEEIEYLSKNRQKAIEIINNSLMSADLGK